MLVEKLSSETIVSVTKVVNSSLVVVLECENTTSEVAITVFILLFRLVSLVSVDSVKTTVLFLKVYSSEADVSKIETKTSLISFSNVW